MTEQPETICNETAEQATLGAILVNPNILPAISVFLSGDDFYLLRHTLIWEAIQMVAARHEPIDNLTVIQQLQDTKKLEDIGGPGYLSQLVTETPTSLHGTFYARLVQKAAVRRQLLKQVDSIRKLALDDTLTTEQVLQQSDALLASIQPPDSASSISLHDAVHQQLDVIDRARDGLLKVTGIPTGISRLDETIGGFRKARTYFVGARTHMGKTSFMLSTALNAAKAGARVLWISLEEVKEDVANRLLAIETGLNKDHIATGNLDDIQYTRVMEGASRIAGLSFTIESRSQMTTRQFYTVVKAKQRQDGLDLVVADYMQLFTSGEAKIDSTEYQRLNRVSSNFATTARDLNVPIMIGVQNNRDSENNHAKPTLRSFKGTGNIEQDADVAILLYRGGFYKATDEPDMAELIVAKNKVNGNLGTILSYSDALSFRFSDWSARHLRQQARVINLPKLRQEATHE